MESTPWYQKDWLRYSARALLGLILIAAIIFLLLALTSPTQAQNGSLTRSTGQHFVFLDQPLPVEVTFDTSNLPNCNTTRRQTNIVLALDRSGSMSGPVLAQVLNGAQQFILNVDLSQTALAVVLFNNTPATLQNWSSDLTVLQRALASDIKAEGQTSISAALRYGAGLFDAAPLSGGQNVIVLFTDGGEKPPEPVIAVANEIKNKNGRIAIISIQGSDYSPDLLSRLVSSPDDLVTAITPAELSTLFSNIAQRVTPPRASRLSLSEPYNRDGFDLAEPAAGTLSARGELTWTVPVVYDAAVRRTYTLQPKTIGWLPVTSAAGGVTLQDCSQKNQSFAGPTGPYVLISPPAAWLWLLLPLLLLLALLGFWPKKGPRTEPPVVPSDPFVQPPMPASFTRGVQPLPVDVEEIALQPTLVVGLGETGWQTLNLIKKDLLERGEGSMPKGVSLLWLGLGATAAHHANETGLVEAEKHVITPDYFRIQLNANPGPRSTDFRWWKEYRDADQAETRVHGRMAFFWDLLVNNNGQLLAKVRLIAQDVARGANRTFRVIFVCSPPEGEAAMLPDVAFWLRGIFHENISHMQPWLLLKPVSKQKNENEPKRRYASLREIQRFLVANNQLMETSDGQYAVQDGYLFDGCLVFDQAAQRADEPRAVLRAMVDQLLALMETASARQFEQDLNRITAMHTQNEAMFMTASSFCYYLPVEPIRRAIEARLARDVFFASGKEPGIPPGFFALQPNGTKLQEEGFNPRQMALEFLHSQIPGLNNSPFPFNWLADSIDGYWPEGPVKGCPDNVVEGLRWGLIIYLNQLMNQEGYSLSLAKAKALLSGLLEVFDLAASGLQNQYLVWGKKHLAPALVSNLEGFREVVNAMKADLTRWERALVEGGNRAAAVPLRRFRTSDSQEAAPQGPVSILEEMNQRCKRSLEDLKADIEPTSSRVAVLDAVLGEKPSAEDVVAHYYERFFLAPQQGLGNTLQQLARRMGWHWDMERGVARLRFIFLPPGNTYTENADKEIWYPSSFTPDDAEKLVRNMQELTPVLSRVLRRNLNVLSEVSRENLHDALLPLRKPEPLLDFDQILDLQYGRKISYLFLPGGQTLANWYQELRDLNLTYVPNDNPHRLTALWMTYNIPFKSLKLPKTDRENYYPAPDLQVYPAEQVAAELEAKMQQGGDPIEFSPRFTRLMCHRALFEKGLLAYLYGWLGLELDDLNQTTGALRLPSREPVYIQSPVALRPTTDEQLLENWVVLVPWKTIDAISELHPNYMQDTLQHIERALAAERARPYAERKARYDRVENEIIPKLKKAQEDPFRQDLGRYLGWLLKQERLQYP